MPRITSPSQHSMARALLSTALRCVIEDGSHLVIASHKPLPSTCYMPCTRLGPQNPSRKGRETGRKVQTLNPLHPNTFLALVLKLRGRGSEHIVKNGWNMISEAYWNSPLPEPCYRLGPGWGDTSVPVIICIRGLVSDSGQSYSLSDLRKQKPNF